VANLCTAGWRARHGSVEFKGHGIRVRFHLSPQALTDRLMSQLVLGVTGSVAAIRTPALFAALRGQRHRVRVVATESALYFFDPAELTVPASQREDTEPADPVYRDRDEWPGDLYHRGDPVLHIVFRDWASLLVIAPLDANTLAKFALGLCDNFLTCLFRAWDFSKPVILAPAMNTSMWHNPSTARHLGQLLLDHGQLSSLPDRWSVETAADHFARHAPNLILIPPQSKRLACGDIGMGAMAEVKTIAESVREWSALQHLDES
jgi:phosphopantothenoylcysteine decarboxylase